MIGNASAHGTTTDDQRFDMGFHGMRLRNLGARWFAPYVPQSSPKGQGDPTLVGQKRHDAAKAAGT
jgi:hypothetical protein